MIYNKVSHLSKRRQKWQNVKCKLHKLGHLQKKSTLRMMSHYEIVVNRIFVKKVGFAC